ncbi:MAG TPA: hypothetical protein DDZ44_10615 [Syntrophomonas wolfei]|uniref:Uncharacterized protein n=1 Tax=Syntrophomonas wolfei TaxID=863 RepID=A0A354YYF9_9FIRM|nr:PQQ-binding-like beta-propeller repeat protein [Syntrophomonas wolfei]HBK54378.1 hypothetical protein [Syntrophomonas wolfei]
MKTKSTSLSILGVLVLLLVGMAWGGTSLLTSEQAWAEEIAFDQNQGGYGGYQAGLYDSEAVQPAADNWTRQSRYTAGTSPRFKWEFSIASPIVGTAVIGADGTLYFGARNGIFYAVDRDGKERWSFRTGYEIVSSAAIGADGTIYTSSKDGSLYALNPNGTLKWVFIADNIFESSPVIGADGTLYIGGKDGRLYAVNPDGSEKWIFPTAGIDNAVAVGNDGFIYVSTRDGKLFCLKADGTEKWKCNLEAITSSPALDKDGNIYICSGKSLYLVSPQGKIRFAYNLNGSSEVNPPLAIACDGSIYAGADVLYRFAPSGTANWTAAVFNCSAPLLGADGTVYVASSHSSGMLYAIAKDGSKIWDYPVGGIEGGVALGEDGIIYVGSRDGKLYAIETCPLEVKACDPPHASENIALDKTIRITLNKGVLTDRGYDRINLTDELTNIISIQKSMEGNTLVVDPTVKLEKNHNYSLKIPADAFKDITGGNLKEDFILRFSTFSEKSQVKAEFTIGQKIYRSDEEIRAMNAIPFLQNGRSFVPVRYLALALGVPENAIIWDDSTQSVKLLRNEVTVEVSTKNNRIIINGKTAEMDITPLNKEGHIYLPARFIAEAFGFRVDWNQARQTIQMVSAN